MRGVRAQIGATALLWALATGGIGIARAAGPASVDAPPPAGPSVDERLREIQARVQAALVYPPLARRRSVAGTTQVELEIDARGQATAVRTRSSSGSALLDAAAEQAVRDAAPLPFVYGRLVIPVRFELAPAR